MKINKHVGWRWVLLGCALVMACAAGPNSHVHVASAEGTIAGFWLGVWHGLIAPITFLISLFKDGVRIYEVHNNGGWYDFGFLCGIGLTHGGHAGGRAAARRSRPKDSVV